MKKPWFPLLFLALTLAACTSKMSRMRVPETLQTTETSLDVPVQSEFKPLERVLLPTIGAEKTLALEPLNKCVKSSFENGKIDEREMAWIPKKRFEKILAKSNAQEEVARSGEAREDELAGAVEKQEDRKNGDAMVYGGALLMALATMGAIARNRSRITRLTRWAKANPRKAQWLISALQLPLLGLGALTGYNLKVQGVDVSDTVPYVFGGVMALGFLTVPFFAKRKVIALPKKVLRNQLAYMGIALSSMMITLGFGNQVVDKHPDSFVAHALKSADHSVFSDTDSHQYEPTKEKSVQKRHKIKTKLRQWVSAGSCALAVLLIILLVGTTCAGICLIIGGLAGVAENAGLGILLAVLGAAIVWGSIKGIIGASKWCREGGSSKTKSNSDEGP